MAATNNDDTPSVPVPPVEPTPAVPTPPVPPAPPAPPAPPTPPVAPPAARPDPYAAPGYTPPAPGYAAAPPAYTAPQGYAPAGPPQGLSIASMITGIAGVLFSLFAFGFLPALAAVITGHLAQKRQPYAKPFWLTGIITGYVGIGISLIYGAFLLIAIIAAVGSASYFG